MGEKKLFHLKETQGFDKKVHVFLYLINADSWRPPRQVPAVYLPKFFRSDLPLPLS